MSEKGKRRRWRLQRRSGESRNPESVGSLLRLLLPKKVDLDSGLRRNAGGASVSFSPHFLLFSERELEGIRPLRIFKTRIPQRSQILDGVLVLDL